MKMNRTNTAGRILVLLLTALLVLSLAACGENRADDDMTESARRLSRRTPRRRLAMYKDLMEQENAHSDRKTQ